MAHAWSKCQFFSPIKELHVREHSAFVNRQMIRLTQFSCNCAFLDKEELCECWLYYNFSALNKCDTWVEWKWSLNWCQDMKSKMSFFSEIPKYFRKENTWRFYLYWRLLICKSRTNLIFQVLLDYYLIFVDICS